MLPNDTLTQRALNRIRSEEAGRERQEQAAAAARDAALQREREQRRQATEAEIVNRLAALRPQYERRAELVASLAAALGELHQVEIGIQEGLRRLDPLIDAASVSEWENPDLYRSARLRAGLQAEHERLGMPEPRNVGEALACTVGRALALRALAPGRVELAGRMLSMNFSRGA